MTLRLFYVCLYDLSLFGLTLPFICIFTIIDYAFRSEYRRLGARHAAQANVCRTIILSQ